MKRSDGARVWSTVLSERAQVRVAVGLGAADVAGVVAGRPDSGGVDGPGGRVGWVSGGCAVAVEHLRFARSHSAVAIAVAWLARGSPESAAAIAGVEAFCADTGYPQTRFDAGALAAAELLRRPGHGDIAEMGALLAQPSHRSRRPACSRRVRS
ncbi:MAG TPA: hypothetical protein VIJ00_09005 [Nakamurella sp.]